MISNKQILAFFFSLILALPAFSQLNMFEEKIPVSNNLFKVKNNNRWGLIDTNGNLVLSIEYNEPLFMNGLAVLTKYGSIQLECIIDSVGNTISTPPYFINNSFPFVTDGMLAVRKVPGGDWGFLNVQTGELLNVNIKGFKVKNQEWKKLGLNGKDVKGNFVFDYVAPFREEMAAVHSKNTGWHHIDVNGNERLKNPNQSTSFFRSSLHNGESVIFDDRGVVLCKEEPSGNAGVINYIDKAYEIKDYTKGLHYPYVITTNGSTLSLNYKFQADKYENFQTGDSVIFIERPKIIPVVEEPKDSLRLERDIEITLSKEAVSASSKGVAAVTVNVTNVGEFDAENLYVSIDINGTCKSWEGPLPIGATNQITLQIPAKFSVASVTRDLNWTVKTEWEEIKGTEIVTIKRYKPKRR